VRSSVAPTNNLATSTPIGSVSAPPPPLSKDSLPPPLVPTVVSPPPRSSTTSTSADDDDVFYPALQTPSSTTMNTKIDELRKKLLSMPYPSPSSSNRGETASTSESGSKVKELRKRFLSQGQPPSSTSSLDSSALSKPTKSKGRKMTMEEILNSTHMQFREALKEAAEALASPPMPANKRLPEALYQQQKKQIPHLRQFVVLQ